MRNKKAQTGYFMTYMAFFVLLVIIAMGIVFGTALFFGEESNFKKIHSDLLLGKLSDCFNDNGLVEENSIFEVCNINPEVVDKEFGIKICVFSDDCINEKKNYVAGAGGVLIYRGSNFEICELNFRENNKKNPGCSKGEYNIDGKEIQIIAMTKQEIVREIV